MDDDMNKPAADMGDTSNDETGEEGDMMPKAPGAMPEEVDEHAGHDHAPGEGHEDEEAPAGGM